MRRPCPNQENCVLKRVDTGNASGQWWLSVALFFSIGSPLAGQVAAQKALVPGSVVADFRLADIDGVEHSLFETGDARATVVVFVGWECPMARLYVPRLNQLQETFRDRGVCWLAINSNQHDSLAELQAFVRRSGLAIPVLKDPGNRIADLFGATRTPEVFLLDEKRQVRYHGQIDDQYAPGLQRKRATQNYLADAINQLLASETIALPQTEPAGCIIGRLLKQEADASSAVTYCNQISRILQDNCASCHREGEIGPFALDTYEEVAGWAGMIEEVVSQGRMPPWHANPEYGTFRNDCRLSEDEIGMIRAWVAAGAPQGDPAALPEPRVFATGWQIGEPDLVIAMDSKPHRVPATGTVEYQYFQVDPGFKTDMWVSAAECRPGNRAVIHHIIVGIRGEGEFEGEGVHDSLQSDWIAATAPGSPPMILPPGYAKRIPAGSKLIFQVHYTPNGTRTTDLSSIGLNFVDEETVRMQVLTLKALEHDFRIPPGADNFPVSAGYRFREEVELLSLFPHMHLRGKSFRYAVRFPDGREEVLLDIPRYDFNWQNAYQLAEPRLIPAGTRMRCEAHYDNSENNLANPDPGKAVGWGDQTWEEMMIGYFNVAVDRK
jgi:peroxiredoxin/mono/diheme cytochrome c family protein